MVNLDAVEQVGPDVGQTRLRKAQIGVLWATIVVLALPPLVFTFFFFGGVLPLPLLSRPGVSVSLTPAASGIYAICAAVLLVACVILQAVAPRGRLMLAVLGLLFVDGLTMLTNPLGLAVITAAAVALLFASILTAHRRPGAATAAVIVCSIVLSLAAGGALLVNEVARALDAGIGSLVTTTDYVRAPSPDGKWLLVAEQIDEGALGGSVGVWVERNLLGVLTLRRDVYGGDWGQPKVRWIGAHTVRVGKHRVDLLTARSIIK